MMKKLFAIVLAFTVVSVQASVVSNNGLKTAFDELNYSLSVEWDQQDKDVYAAQTKKFTDEVAKLQEDGLTNSDLVDFALSQVKDANMKKEVETAMTMIQINKLSKAEARKMVNDIVAKSYNQGASWSSDATLIVIGVVVLLVVAVAIAGGTVAVSTGPSCYDEYVCVDYYDSWGYYWYTDCYYETYCY